MKPIIGINVDIEDGPPQVATQQANYFRAIQLAGGIPLLIPPMPDDDLNEVLGRINGLMLIGGKDYDPKHYNEKAVSQVHLASALRDDFDIRLIQRAVVGSNMPVLGLCAGCQALNIGLGGSLIQDIPSTHPESKIQHATEQGFLHGWNHHTVTIDENSKLGKIYGRKTVSVPTSHHQAVKRVGAGLQAVAHAEDGIVEAVEFSDKPFVIGVQWHPERDYDNNKEIFAEFIKHAAARKPVGAGT